MAHMSSLLTSNQLGIFAALASTASWALCAVLFKKLGEKLDPIGMTMAKALFSALLLLPLVLCLYLNLNISWREIGLLAASGIIGVGLGDSFFFAALGKLSPLVLAIILLAGPDILAGVLGVICLGEMPGWRIWGGIVFIMIAMGLLLLPREIKNKQSKTTFYGVILALLSLGCTAVSMVIVKPVLLKVPSLEATMLRMFFGGAVLLLYGIFSRKLPVWSTPFRTGEYKWGFIGTVVLVTFGGFWLSLLAVKMLDLVVASALMSLEPLFVLPFMILFGKHQVHWNEIAGMAFAIAGVLLIAIYNN